MSSTSQARRPLSTADRSIIVLHAASAAILGTIAFFSANDLDWGDLQRIVVLMLVVLWAAGIAVTAFIARRVSNRWIRLAVLLIGPLIGIMALIASTA